MDRRGRHIVVLIVWLALFFALGSGVWNQVAGQLMLILYLFASVLAYGFCAFLSRCPQCSMPLLLRPVRIVGIRFYLWSIITPRRCRHCGQPYSKKG